MIEMQIAYTEDRQPIGIGLLKVIAPNGMSHAKVDYLSRALVFPG